MSEKVKVVVTGAAGQIGYSLVPRLLDGVTFGNKTVDLELVEIPQVVDKLEGLVMELEDSYFPTMGSVNYTDDFSKAADGADWFLLVGSIPRGIVYNGKKIEERSDLLNINGGIFVDQGKAVGEKGADDAKILVVGNPANTNALIGRHAAHNAGQLWMAMTMLDSSRAKSVLAKKLGVGVGDVQRMTIWGNHSATQYPDLHHTQVSGKSAIDLVDQGWYEGNFIPVVQQRGAAIIKSRGASSAASAANAAIEHMRSWALGSDDGDWVSMGVYSDGSYGITEGLIYSFPCVCEGGDWSIVQDLEINDFSRGKMSATELELMEERDAVTHLLP